MASRLGIGLWFNDLDPPDELQQSQYWSVIGCKGNRLRSLDNSENCRNETNQTLASLGRASSSSVKSIPTQFLITGGTVHYYLRLSRNTRQILTQRIRGKKIKNSVRRPSLTRTPEEGEGGGG